MMSEENKTRLSEMVNRVWSDEGLRAALLRDPIGFIRDQGVDVPDGIQAKVVTGNDEISLRFMSATTTADAPLTEKQLDQVVGGAGNSGVMYLVFTFKLVAVKTISG